MFLRDGVPVAGLMATTAPSGSPDMWSVYLTTDDARATVERATAAGATVLVEPMQIDDLGTMAMLLDPAGAAVGVWQPDTFPGTGLRGEPGGPGWFETLSTDYDRSVAFYRDVFGWEVATMSDTPEFRYSTLGRDEDARAGIMDATAFLGDQPSRWQFYLQVDDTDATVAQAVRRRRHRWWRRRGHAVRPGRPAHRPGRGAVHRDGAAEAGRLIRAGPRPVPADPGAADQLAADPLATGP